jgi:glycosyltransferase involved in cell wall biosynthesis
MKVYLGYYIEKLQAKRIANQLKNDGIDLVYTNTRLPMIGSNIAKILKTPHIMHVREIGTVEPLWGKWDFEALYDSCDKILLISEALRMLFLEHVQEDKLILSRNGISYHSVPYQYNDLLSKQEVHIIIVGRLVPDKGQKDAIMAINHIVKNDLIDKNVVLHIVGSSPKRTHVEWYEKELKKLVTDLRLDKNIVFEGEIEDVRSMRTKMDVEVVCAIRETFGRVTVEAMRSGLLAIGSDTGGTPEIISDGCTGYLYKQGDAVDLAEKIAFSLKNVERFNCIRKNALEFAKQNFTVERNCLEIYNTLRSCVKKDDK